MNHLKHLAVLLAALVTIGTTARAERPPSPFGLSASVSESSGASVVQFKFLVPAEHVIYAERLHFETADGENLTPERMPDPIVATDKATGHEKRMYDRDFAVELKLAKELPAILVVKFQGCSNSACYFPEKHTFVVGADGLITEQIAPAESTAEVAAGAGAFDTGWSSEAAKFSVLARTTGYLKADDFQSFLKKSLTGGGENDPLAMFKKAGMALTLLLILLGGVGLNLTPCVLPLIPINLAIIGAGKAADSRRTGFLHGATYGAGMALTYGVLGLAVVLTGAKFGTLNSSIWFNIGIALVFALLSLGMFGKFNLDFSRYEAGMGDKLRASKRHVLVAFGLGAIAALLAGACVAPVVISVLLLSANLYANGLIYGLLLPFLLGLGMALPWPFMGASLSFLPKPGRWMERVKHLFGVFILLFALYYAHLAYGLLNSHRRVSSLASAPGAVAVSADANQNLIDGLRRAEREGKPVFIDFQASWCKNCEAMEHTVFNQSSVQQHLNDFVVVKYQAERPNESPAREVLDHFGAMGLPTYVVLAPNQKKKDSPN